MRVPKYLSPTSLTKWVKDQETFYLDYLAESRPPRSPQTQPMSIGSAFDAYCKSFLHNRLFGKGHKDANAFDLKTIFDKQVEPNNRDWAWTNGKYVFDWYIGCGALLDMMKELEGSIGEPKFELEVQSFVSLDIHSVPFLGKPDIYLTNSQGVKMILDWKVNGYCSQHGQSPKPGYVKIFPGLESHKDAFSTKYKGVLINGGIKNGTQVTLKDIDGDWNRQVNIYAWLCGCSVGEEFILGIDQIACRGTSNGLPGLRCAKHRYKSNTDHQIEIYRLAVECWRCCNNGPEKYFSGLTDSESKSRCDMLELRAKQMFAGTGDAEFDDVCRIGYEF